MDRTKPQLSDAKRGFTGRLFLGPLACLIFLVPSIAFSATYYTAKTGGNGNTCAQAQNESTPKLTIAGGIGCLSAGDTLVVKSGIYNESLNSTPSGTSWANATTIRANPGDTVRLAPTSGSAPRAATFGSGKQYIIVDGFEVNSGNLHDGFKIEGTSHHIRIQNCEIWGATYMGIMDATGASTTRTSNLEILNNIIHDNGGTGSTQRHGIYITSQGNRIWGNTVYRNSAYGIQLWNASGTVSNNDIQYNKSYDNRLRSGYVWRGSNNLFANNLGWDNGIDGMVHSGGSNNKIYNNTMYSNNGNGISAGGSDLVRNNICFANGASQIAGGTRSNNLTSNPSFMNAGADDFHLQSGSAARDAGATLAEVTNDFDKVPRPQGGGVEIGAFEYTGQSAPPPPVASTPLAPSGFAAL